jgi:hypothetical protein
VLSLFLVPSLELDSRCFYRIVVCYLFSIPALDTKVHNIPFVVLVVLLWSSRSVELNPCTVRCQKMKFFVAVNALSERLIRVA